MPVRQSRWQRWDDVTDLFAGPADADWKDDRELVEDTLRDPWAEQ